MNKPKTRPTQGPSTGVYKSDTIKDTADGLGIAVSDAVASALASDVEYRIHQVVEEAARFMRHGRRTTLTTSDTALALRTLNIEPLYGHLPSNPPSFRRALPFPQLPTAGSVFFVEDEEIDFDRVLREEKIALPRGVSWTAHWLAVEGVQPLVPENPPAVPRDEGDAKKFLPTQPPQSQQQQQQTQNQNSNLPHGHHHPLVKQVLSRELQLYYARLTSALLPPVDGPKRTAALASLRSDAGLQALLPYLVRWVGEGVVGALREPMSQQQQQHTLGHTQQGDKGKVLEVLMEVINAVLDNKSLFIEPYLHQLLPPVLSTLLHSSLPPGNAAHLRIRAAQTLSLVLTKHSTTYPSLSPRIMKTLLLALLAPGKAKGTREGAVRGLRSVGKEAIRKGLVEGGGARVVGSEEGCVGDREVVLCVLEALMALRQGGGDDDMVVPLEEGKEEDAKVYEKLKEVLGDFFAQQVAGDAAWAREVVGTVQ